jgi:hypothetical protein
MSALGFCRECGNLYQRHYHYCPFCGNKRRDDDQAEDTTVIPARKGAKAVRMEYLERLACLEKRLSLIDQELDAFIVHHR